MWVETDQPDWNAVWGDDGGSYVWVDVPSYEPPPETEPDPQPETQPDPEPDSVVSWSWYDNWQPAASEPEPAQAAQLTPSPTVYEEDFSNDYGGSFDPYAGNDWVQDFGGDAQLPSQDSGFDPYAGNDWVQDYGGDAPVYDPYTDLDYSSGLGGDANVQRVVEANGDVYESYDGGVTWDYLGTGVLDGQTHSLITYYDPDTGDSYESYDGGVTWDYTGHQATIEEIQNAAQNAWGPLPGTSTWQPVDTPFPNTKLPQNDRSGAPPMQVSGGSSGSSGGSNTPKTNVNGTVPTNGTPGGTLRNPTGNSAVNPLTLLGNLIGTGLAISNAKKGQVTTTGGSTLQLTAGQNGGAISRTSAPVSKATRSPASLTALPAQKKAAGPTTGGNQSTLLVLGGLVLAAKLLA